MPYPGAHAKSRPGHPAIVMAGSGETITYSELNDRSNQLAQLLYDHGLRAGDHIAVFMDTHPRFAEVLWAALRSGLYLTPISTSLAESEAAYILGDCGARVLIATAAHGDVAAEIRRLAKSSVERWLMIDDEAAIVAGGGWESYEAALAEWPTSPLDHERPGTTMYYTSGTTGRPKGVLRPLPANHITEFVPRTYRYFADTYRFGPEMVYLSPAPIYHAAPLAFIQTTHRFGGTAVLMPTFDPHQCLAALERYEVTHSQFTPAMFARLLALPVADRRRYDLSALEVAVHASAPCPVSIKRQMINWWGPILVEYYAGSEGNGTTFITSDEWLERPGSVGRVRDGRLHICDRDGNDLRPGEIGKIYFSGAGSFVYHNDPARTAESQLPGGRTTLGDIGYVDREGYLYLIDRAANTIKRDDEIIYPRKVEDVLIAHPDVLDVAVVGGPTEEGDGVEVAAVVQLVDCVEPRSSLVAELLDYGWTKLARHERPTTVRFVDQLPRQPTGKLNKKRLVELEHQQGP